MNIRIAERGDIPALVRFNQAMAHETEDLHLHSDVLTPGVTAVFDDEAKGFYVVAEDAGEIVGGLMVTREWSDWRNAWFWWIQSVYTLPDHRGKGVYSKLYQYVKDRAEAEGNVCGFRLYVERENERAQHVYEHLGMHRSHYWMYQETK
jgi:GNAT superfamily N-acetyltransferase